MNCSERTREVLNATINTPNLRQMLGLGAGAYPGDAGGAALAWIGVEPDGQGGARMRADSIIHQFSGLAAARQQIEVNQMQIQQAQLALQQRAAELAQLQQDLVSQQRAAQQAQAQAQQVLDVGAAADAQRRSLEAQVSAMEASVKEAQRQKETLRVALVHEKEKVVRRNTTIEALERNKDEAALRPLFEIVPPPSQRHLQARACARLARIMIGHVNVDMYPRACNMPVVDRSNLRFLVVLGVIPDALNTAGCAQSRAVSDFVHTSTFLVNFGSVSSLFEVFQTCENLYYASWTHLTRLERLKLPVVSIFTPVYARMFTLGLADRLRTRAKIMSSDVTCGLDCG